ncbi:MAG: hypothetical protein SH809_07670 [Rhodothermales bacterium]|nr:hypothetical protein [Rhodothermales bacterium]
MGQQQLLLLVLGIVIVGLAVVVGIQAFSENKKKANADALVNDAIRIASDAQAWKLKPAAFGGGADETLNVGFTGLLLGQMGYEVDGAACTAMSAPASSYCNLNGYFTIAAAQDLIITANSVPIASGGGDLNVVVVTVAGTRPEDISTTINAIAP